MQRVVEHAGGAWAAAAVIVGVMHDPELFTRSRGFDAAYGLELLEVGGALARGRLVLREEHLQPFGIVHGGIYAAMAEGLASIATASVVLPQGSSASGMSNNTSFLRPLSSGTVHATAICKHSGRTTWVWEVEMADDGGRICALSRVTIAVRALPPDSQPALP